MSNLECFAPLNNSEKIILGRRTRSPRKNGSSQTD